MLSNPPASSTCLFSPSTMFLRVLSLKVVTRTTTLSPSVRARAAVNSMTSRVNSRSNGSCSPSRTIVTTISDPTGPRIRSTAWFNVNPRTLSPSTWVIKSPASTPASNAGVPSIGETTFTNPSSIVTSIPRPPNSPRVWVRMSSAALGAR